MDTDLVRTGFFLVDKRDDISGLVGYLRGEVTDVPIVVDDGRPFGILNERGLLRSRVHPDAHVEHYVVGTRFLPAHGSAAEAVALCLTSALPIVPVEDHGTVVGFIRAEDLVKEMAAQAGSAVTAHEVQVPAEAVPESMGMEKAVHLLREASLPLLPVVDELGHLTGVLRRRDAVQLLFTDGLEHRVGGDTGFGVGKGTVDHRSEVPVQAFMDSRFARVAPGAALGTVTKALLEFGDAVVVQGQRPAGVVTPWSVLRVLTAAR